VLVGRSENIYTRAHICTISLRDFHQRRLFSSLEYNNILNPVNRAFFCRTHTHARAHTKVKPRVYIILYVESSVRDHGGGSGRGPFNRVYFNTFGLRRDEEGTRAIFFRPSSRLSSSSRIYRTA